MPPYRRRPQIAPTGRGGRPHDYLLCHRTSGAVDWRQWGGGCRQLSSGQGSRAGLLYFDLRDSPARRILLRLVGVKFSNLVHGTEQIDLFNDVATQISLNNALDGIRLRFGNDKVMKAI